MKKKTFDLQKYLAEAEARKSVKEITLKEYLAMPVGSLLRLSSHDVVKVDGDRFEDLGNGRGWQGPGGVVTQTMTESIDFWFNIDQ